MKGASVSLSELAEDNVYIDISDNLKSKIRLESKKGFSSIKEFANNINENEKTLINFFWYKNKVPLKIFLKIVKHLNINNYEKDVKWIGGKTRGKGIKNPKLPFNFNSYEGGTFVAAVLGDGTFLLNLEIGYRNYNSNMLEHVEQTANKLFGKVDIISKDETSIIFPRILGRIIYVLGLRPGRKTVTNPNIPKFVLNGSIDCKIGFLKQISDDEGSALIRPPNSYSIRYEFAREIPYEKISEKSNYVPNLLSDLHKLFRDLGYSVTNIYGGRVYKGRKKQRFVVSWVFDIQGKSSLEKFARDINFRIEKRRKKLEYGLSKIKINNFGKRAKYMALYNFYEISKKNDCVTKHELTKFMGKTRRNSESWLIKLEKNGLIKRVAGGNFIVKKRGFCGLCGRTPLRYIITNKGIDFLEINAEKSFQTKIIPSFNNKRVYECKWSSKSNTYKPQNL